MRAIIDRHHALVRRAAEQVTDDLLADARNAQVNVLDPVMNLLQATGETLNAITRATTAQFEHVQQSQSPRLTAPRCAAAKPMPGGKRA